MPSISSDLSRHVVIDARPGHYLCFPDVRHLQEGRLLCVYRQTDKHVADRMDLLFKTSDDLGQTWSLPRYLTAGVGHCPRITQLEDGRILVIDDHSQSQFWSMDNAGSFIRSPYTGAYMPLPDRVLPLHPGHFLTTAHHHRGDQALPKIRQAPSEQFVYISNNQGVTWREHSVLAFDPNLVLCEASMIRLDDGRLLALMRENSFVFEPMYFCLSEDQGGELEPSEPHSAVRAQTDDRAHCVGKASRHLPQRGARRRHRRLDGQHWTSVGYATTQVHGLHP